MKVSKRERKKKKKKQELIPKEKNMLNATSHLCCESTFASQACSEAWTPATAPGLRGLLGHHRSYRQGHTHTLTAPSWLRTHFLGWGRMVPITSVSTQLLVSSDSFGHSHSSPCPGQCHRAAGLLWCPSWRTPKDLLKRSSSEDLSPAPFSAFFFFFLQRKQSQGYLFLIFRPHLQLLPDMAGNASLTVVFSKILSFHVHKVCSAAWCWSWKHF